MARPAAGEHDLTERRLGGWLGVARTAGRLSGSHGRTMGPPGEARSSSTLTEGVEPTSFVVGRIHHSELSMTASDRQSWCRPLRRLKRAGSVLVIACCKLSLVVSMLEGGQLFELSGEARGVEIANPLERHVASSRLVQVEQLAVQNLRRAPQLSRGGVQRHLPGSPTQGHLLPNGLCAPQRC